MLNKYVRPSKILGQCGDTQSRRQPRNREDTNGFTDDEARRHSEKDEAIIDPEVKIAFKDETPNRGLMTMRHRSKYTIRQVAQMNAKAAVTTKTMPLAASIAKKALHRREDGSDASPAIGGTNVFEMRRFRSPACGSDSSIAQP
jgi:hypothetical protein